MAKPRVGSVQYTKKTRGPEAYQTPTAYQNESYTGPPRTSIPENSGSTKPKPVPGRTQIPENSNKPPRTSIPEKSFGTPTSAADAIFTTRRKGRKNKQGLSAERLDAVRRRMQNNG